jgi:hypothetical protein
MRRDIFGLIALADTGHLLRDRYRSRMIQEHTMNDVPFDVKEQLGLLKLGSLLNTAGQEKSWPAQYRVAADAYNEALRQTVTYIESLQSGAISKNQQTEIELSRLWSNASAAVNTFDPDLANRCFVKGQGWLDSNVWTDPQYKKYGIGIDDMRKAFMEFNKSQYAHNQKRVPDWFSKAGVGFAIATFLSLFYLLVGPGITAEKRILFAAWMAFCVAASAAFLGGTAVSKGTLKIPFMKEAPVQFSAVGGIGIFVVVFLILAAALR